MTRSEAVIRHGNYRLYLHRGVQMGYWDPTIFNRSIAYAKFLGFFVTIEWKEVDEFGF
jgi:hypothetical protein